MSRSVLEYLRHILDECVYLQNTSLGVTKAEFLSDATYQRAFVRSIEIIGEASKQVPSDFKEKYPEVEWRLMSGMRDRLIHGYFGVDYEIVWDVVTNKIPDLQVKIEHILVKEVS